MINMISEDLKQKIIPHLLEMLDESEKKYVDEMFSEVYYTNYDGLERVTLKPHPGAGDIAVQFYVLNGNFIELTSWNYIKEKGKLL